MEQKNDFNPWEVWALAYKTMTELYESPWTIAEAEALCEALSESIRLGAVTARLADEHSRILMARAESACNMAEARFKALQGDSMAQDVNLFN